jgi:hypothetical protein
MRISLIVIKVRAVLHDYVRITSSLVEYIKVIMNAHYMNYGEGTISITLSAAGGWSPHKSMNHTVRSE